jgi:general secretion pathway protein G
MPNPQSVTPPRRRREGGFTLLELMVVVAILGVLAALVVPNVVGRFSKAKHDAAALSIASLSEILEQYKLDVGTFPSNDQGLQALVTKPSDATNWSGPYVKKGKIMLADPWGNQFVYRYPSSRSDHDYDICSYGAHGQPGGTGEDATICNE